MDPLNNSATPNPAAPAAPAPAAPATAPAPASAAPAAALAPAPAPAAPVAPAPAPVIPNPPVNPVVTPGNPAAAPAAPGTMSMAQMFQPQATTTQAEVFAETTAISAPEGPKAPDPVEEELKAPLKAAAPAPGSIGSAVSGPSDGSPQNVAFNDPANNPMTANAAPVVKKNSFLNKLTAKTKMDKKTLTMLIAVAGVILVLLVVVLVMVMNGGI